MAQVEPGGFKPSFAYDSRGNLITATSAAGIKRYMWTPDNRLVSISTPGQQTVSFTYSADGLRVTKTVGTTTATTSYDSGRVVAETTGGSSTTYTYDDQGVPLTITLPSGATYSYHYDAGGSVVQLTDSGHNVSAAYTYDAWGRYLATSGDSALISANPITYRGALRVRWEPDIGLYLMGARWYDPTSGRFLSKDPIAAQEMESPYVYAANNPVTNSDPTGLRPCAAECGPDDPWSDGPSGDPSTGRGRRRPAPARHPAVRTFPVPSRVDAALNRSSYTNAYRPGGSRYARGLHGGIDIAAPQGAAVVATCSGVAFRPDSGKWGGWGSEAYGNQVLIRCKSRSQQGTWGTFYAELDRYRIHRKPVSVRVGTRIGDVGSSGVFASGNHLHFELHARWNEWGSGFKDPYPALRRLQRRKNLGYNW